MPVRPLCHARLTDGGGWVACLGGGCTNPANQKQPKRRAPPRLIAVYIFRPYKFVTSHQIFTLSIPPSYCIKGVWIRYFPTATHRFRESYIYNSVLVGHEYTTLSLVRTLRRESSPRLTRVWHFRSFRDPLLGTQWSRESICCLDRAQVLCQESSHVVLQNPSSGYEEFCVKWMRDMFFINCQTIQISFFSAEVVVGLFVIGTARFLWLNAATNPTMPTTVSNMTFNIP